MLDPAVTSESLTRSGRPKRRCSTQSNSELQTEVKAKPAAQKRKRKEKNEIEPALEDIYRNKLWRMQMPKERLWPAIVEQPKIDGGGTAADRYLFTTKQFKCSLEFGDVPTQARLRLRRKKALANGWKPLTKKRLETLDKQLSERLSVLDNCLGAVDGNVG